MVIFQSLQTTQDELTMIGWETRNDSRKENNNDCNQRMDKSQPKLQQRSKEQSRHLLTTADGSLFRKITQLA